MTHLPASNAIKVESSSVIRLLRNLFGSIGSFLGPFLILSSPILNIKLLVGLIILWRSYTYMVKERRKILSIIIGCIGALFALTSYI